MKSKILLALTLLLGVSTTTWAVGNLGKANQKKHAYTNEDVWAAYEGFNNTLLDSNKYIYKTNSSYPSAVDRGNGAAAIWCQPIYWDMAMNAYKLAKAQKDRKKTSYYKTLCEKIFAGNKAQYCQFDFDDNNENTGWFIYDDIMWWTISLARGYELFGVDEYLKLSEASFKRVWYGSEKVGDTGSYDKENGGMFWKIEKNRPTNGRIIRRKLNILPKVKKSMNGEWKISWIKQQERLPIAVMEMAIPHGKRMYTTRQPLSERPYCFIRRPERNVIWTMLFWQQTIQ